jgi:hypothetical protein
MLPEIDDIPMQHSLSILTHGSVLGEEDVLQLPTYRATLRCVSKEGTLLTLSKDYFIRFLTGCKNSRIVALDRIAAKDKRFFGCDLSSPVCGRAAERKFHGSVPHEDDLLIIDPKGYLDKASSGKGRELAKSQTRTIQQNPEKTNQAKFLQQRLVDLSLDVGRILANDLSKSPESRNRNNFVAASF